MGNCQRKEPRAETPPQPMGDVYKVEVEAVTESVWLGEGPHWDAAAQALYFVSIFDRSIHKYLPATGAHTSATLDGMPTFIIPVEGSSEEFVVGLGRRVVVVRWAGADGGAEVVRALATLDADHPTNRLNDAKCDPRGRLFVGSMGEEYEPGKFHMKRGSLYRVEGGGAGGGGGGEARVTRLEAQLDISNGLAWSPAQDTFYFADSFEYAVRAYHYDAHTGDISGRRVVMRLGEEGMEGIADGMCMDSEGMLWIANFDGSQVVRVDPGSGRVVRRVRTPALQTTSVCWGGAALDVLYVTSARMDRGAPQHPPAGCTFAVTGLGVTGLPSHPYKLDL